MRTYRRQFRHRFLSIQLLHLSLPVCNPQALPQEPSKYFLLVQGPQETQDDQKGALRQSRTGSLREIMRGGLGDTRTESLREEQSGALRESRCGSLRDSRIGALRDFQSDGEKIPEGKGVAPQGIASCPQFTLMDSPAIADRVLPHNRLCTR